jgi:CRP-like cAMP-binding protein
VTLSLLQRLWPFRLAGRGAVEKAAGLFELRSFAQGSCVFRQGEKADAVLFVVAGCVRLWREPCAAAEDRVADVSPSSPAPWLGELGVSARVPRAVTAFAALGTTLAAVRADDLASLLALVPGLQRAFLAAMRTYRQADRKRAEQLARAREGGASAVLAMRTRPLRNWAALCAALLLSAAEGDRQHARRAGAGATLSLALGDYV